MLFSAEIVIYSAGVSFRDGGIVERFLWKKFLFDWGLTRENCFIAIFSGYTGAIFVFEGLEALLKPENFFFLKPLYPSTLVLSKGTTAFFSF